MSGPGVGPAQPPVQGPLWGFFLVGVQQMKLEGDHCLPFSASFRNGQSYASAAPYAMHGIWLYNPAYRKASVLL